jgi:hypothetical protein
MPGRVFLTVPSVPHLQLDVHPGGPDPGGSEKQNAVKVVEWQIQWCEVPAVVATMKAFQFLVGLSGPRKKKSTVRKAFTLAIEAFDSSC